MKRLVLVALSSIFVLHAFAETDNVGALWSEVGVTKALPYNLSLEGSFEERAIPSRDWKNRWSVGVGLSYKVNKYFKVGVGYTFIDKHNQKEWKNHYSNKTGRWNGYNIDAANWAHRHRVTLDLSSSVRFWKTFRIGVRERYQYTRQMPRTVDRIKLRDPVSNLNRRHDFDNFEEIEYTTDRKLAKNRHLLRSRLKLSIDKKGWKCEPFVSVEAHNDLANDMHLDKVRSAVGFEYSFTKQHQIGVAYLFNHEKDDDGDMNTHVISVGYNFKF
jgi:hypothetical protein